MELKKPHKKQKEDVLKIAGVFTVFSIIWFVVFDLVFEDLFKYHSIIYILLIVTFFIYTYKYFSKRIKDDINVLSDNGRFDRFIDNLNNNCFYYRHDLTKNFAYVSPTVEKVLGCSVKEFKENYTKYAGEKFVENIFEKHKRLYENEIKQPPFEVVMYNINGSLQNFEVREFPIFDDNNKILAIEGLAHDITEYKKIETELIEKENKYQILFESANDAILIMKGGVYIDCNKKATELFKCSYDQIIMQSPLKFSPGLQYDGQESRDVANEKIKNALDDKPQRFEWLHSRLNGETFWTEVILNKFVFMDQNFILVFVRDIDSRKKIEADLADSEYKFRTVAESTTTAMLIIQEDRFMYMNKAGMDILGIDNEDLFTYKFWEVIHPDDKELVKERGLARQRGEDIPRHYEFRVINQKTKNTVWLDYSASFFKYNGKPALLGSAFDISERKKIEREFNKTQNILKKTIELSPDLYTVIDKNFNIQLCNWKDHEYFNDISETESKCYKAFFKNDTVCIDCKAKAVFETGELVEYEKVNPVDGIKRKIKIYPLYDENNNVESVVEHVQRIK